MGNENFLRYYSLIFGGVKAAKLEKKSPCQITCQIDRYQNIDVINDYFKWDERIYAMNGCFIMYHAEDLASSTNGNVQRNLNVFNMEF